MSRDIVYALLIINLVSGVVYYIRSKCEIPLVLSLFNIIVEYRLFSLETGTSDFVKFDYGIDLKFNLPIAYAVSSLIVIGTTVVVYAFMWFYKPPTVKQLVDDSDNSLKAFTLANRNYIIMGLVFFTLLQIVLSSSQDAGSYSFLFKLGNTSFILMLFLLTIFTDYRNVVLKVIYIGVFLFMGYLTYSAFVRFQFLGWIVPMGYYFTRKINPAPKIAILLVGIFFIMVVFSVAGVLRNHSNETASELVSDGLQRMLVADDINFIDGFMMVYQIYPHYLDYDYGWEHLDIIFRPIPRFIWPNKPLAGWVQNYQKKFGQEQKALAGFSPTIYGVYYSEMGEYGNFIFGPLWAWGLAYFYRRFSSFNSILKNLLVGTLLAALLPILRSGDLPGDFAIVLMSYWPLIVFVNYYKKYIKRQLKIEAYRRMVAA